MMNTYRPNLHCAIGLFICIASYDLHLFSHMCALSNNAWAGCGGQGVLYIEPCVSSQSRFDCANLVRQSQAWPHSSRTLDCKIILMIIKSILIAVTDLCSPLLLLYFQCMRFLNMCLKMQMIYESIQPYLCILLVVSGGTLEGHCYKRGGEVRFWVNGTKTPSATQSRYPTRALDKRK